MNKPVKSQFDNTANSNFIAGLLAAILRTSEFKTIAGALVPEVAGSWAGASRLKKIIIWPVAAIIARLLRVPADDSRKTPVKDYLDNADFGQIGSAITAAAQGVNAIHREDPLYLSEKFRPAIRAIIENTDFGELKEMVDGSADDLAALAEMSGEELWRYPAKMVCLLSVIPSLANIISRSLLKTVQPLNALAPDLLADVIVSLVREIDGKTVGLIVNEMTELVRKVHTGSALIGEKGNHALPAAVSRFTLDMMGSVDVPLLLKARGMLGELAGLIRASFIDILEKNPELAKDLFRSQFRALVAIVRTWSRRADAFERLLSDKDIAEEFARGLGDLDAQEIAAVISRLSAIFNSVRRMKPGTIRNFLSQLFSALDPAEAGETFRWFIEDVVDSITPVTAEIVPPLINGIADLIAPDGEIVPEMRDACIRLKRAFDSLEAKA